MGPLAGGFVIEGNTFRASQNGVRSTNTGGTATVIRANTFVDVHYGVSALGNAFVLEGNTFTMRAAPRAQGYGEAVRLAAEHVAGDCSDNQVLNNTMSGQELGVGMYTDGSRIKRLYLSDNQRQKVVNGTLAITRKGGKHQLIPVDVARKIIERNAEYPIFILGGVDTPAQEAKSDPDDPYAEYKIPDDLMW